MTNIPITPTYTTVQNAYGSARSTPVAQTEEQIVSQSFGTMVEDVARQAADTVRAGDETAIAGLAGRVDMQTVVEATMAMDSTVRVSVALRDRMVEAYQEVMRMPI